MATTIFPIETNQPKTPVQLPVGTHVLQLVVEDSAGLRSKPDTVVITVKKSQIEPKPFVVTGFEPKKGNQGVTDMPAMSVGSGLLRVKEVKESSQLGQLVDAITVKIVPRSPESDRDSRLPVRITIPNRTAAGMHSFMFLVDGMEDWQKPATATLEVVGAGPMITGIFMRGTNDPARVFQGGKVEATIVGQNLSDVMSVGFANSGISATVLSSGDTDIQVDIRAERSVTAGTHGFQVVTTSGESQTSGSVTLQIETGLLGMSKIEPSYGLPGASVYAVVHGFGLSQAAKVSTEDVGLMVDSFAYPLVGEIPANLSAHIDPVNNDFALGRNGEIFVCSNGGAWRLDVEAGRMVGTIPWQSGLSVASLAIGPEDNVLAVGSGLNEGNEVYLWDLNQMQTPPVLLKGDSAAVRGLTIGRDVIASSDIYGNVRAWRRSAIANKQAMPFLVIPTGAVVASLAVSTNDTLLAIAGVQTVQVWRITEGTSSTIIKSIDVSPYGALGVAISSDGKYLACALSPNALRIYAMPSCDEVVNTKEFPHSCEHIAFSPEGYLMLADGVLYCFVPPHRVQKLESQHLSLTPAASKVGFSPDRRYMARMVRDKVLVWRFDSQLQCNLKIASSAKPGKYPLTVSTCDGIYSSRDFGVMFEVRASSRGSATPKEESSRKSVMDVGALSGIGPVLSKRLAAKRIRTVADLAAMQPQTLAKTLRVSEARAAKWIEAAAAAAQTADPGNPE